MWGFCSCFSLLRSGRIAGRTAGPRGPAVGRGVPARPLSAAFPGELREKGVCLGWFFKCNGFIVMLFTHLRVNLVIVRTHTVKQPPQLILEHFSHPRGIVCLSVVTPHFFPHPSPQTTANLLSDSYRFSFPGPFRSLEPYRTWSFSVTGFVCLAQSLRGASVACPVCR